MPDFFNIASTLRDTAWQFPDQTAVAWPARSRGDKEYSEVTFRQLDEISDRIGAGLRRDHGVTRGSRIVLMVRPGLEFIAATFALFKIGAVVVLVDPGMGPRRVFRCLDRVEPDGFFAVPLVHALRVLSLGRFRRARFNVTVGARWFWGGATYEQLVERRDPGADAPGSPEKRFVLAETSASDPAAIIFTSGSTGPAKGVVYEHGMFAAQVAALRDFYRIEPGGADLPAFPLFGLFNAAMGMTTVIPDMDPTRPAQVDAAKIVAAIERWNITQSFGSPAIWKRVGQFCDERDIRLPSIRRLFAAGAPVAPEILARIKRALTGEGAEMFTPYGATEALPVCSIAATDVLSRTAERTRQGEGTCVGRPLPTIRLKIIDLVDGPIRSLAEAHDLPAGQVGEIIVRGAVVTREYFRQGEATAAAKIPDGDGFWHRMGDVGYVDADGALWFCGRKAHVVETAHGRMFTDCVEPIFNTHPRVARTALVGVGPRPLQTPVIVAELEAWYAPSPLETAAALLPELRALARAFPHTTSIDRFLIHPGPLPVDVRHNIKINREQLARWAARRLPAPVP